MSIATFFRFAAAVGFAGLIAGTPASAQTTMPPVIVEATAIPSGRVICSGYGCATLLMTMMSEYSVEHGTADEPISPDDAVIDRSQFCARQRAEKPQNCPASDPPPVPGVNVDFSLYMGQISDGCYGHWESGIEGEMSYDLRLQFSGNADQPMSGAYFGNACRSHDACYAAQLGQSHCDSNFLDALDDACGAAGINAATCARFASAYASALSRNGGYAYDSHGLAAECAMWHHDMEQNQCPKQ
ncbi:MAG TPA: hypothetical protein VLF18_08020 [Tahibacter sp.]|uniref:hypothetical protein n=1 Tax=Tahibacter sp. TaxID=2056211 RepID=UPI002D1D8EBE|nr:hypothetical protein [Tahibacter sp.]HSX60128.1 hypothetical protein [Tahibacter sp.]